MKKYSIIILFVLLVAMFCGCSESPADPYESIISKYAELVKQAKSGTLPDSDDGEEFHELIETLEFSALFEIVKECEDVSTLGYSTKDLNGDGVKELIIMESDYVLHALYTVKDGAPVLLDIFDGSAAIDMYGTVYHSIMVDEKNRHFYSKSIADGELKGIELGITPTDDGTDVEYYKTVDGVREKIDESQYSILMLEHIYNYDRSYTIKTAGLRFIPISGEETSAKDAPEIDLSSYDSIISFYSAIVSKYSDSFKDDLKNNVFDDMYVFSDDESYDTFIRLCLAGYKKCPTKTYTKAPAPNAHCAFGYAKKDINGDGIEELVLMTDDFSIVAIFTTINSKPTLVYSARDEECWIGDDGYLRIEECKYSYININSYEEMYYSKCSITKDGKLTTELKIAHDIPTLGNVTFKKFENGSAVNITEEEYNKLYNEQYLSGCPEKCEKNQYMKNHLGLDFVRLFNFPASEITRCFVYSVLGISDGANLTISHKNDSSFDFRLSYYPKPLNEPIIIEDSAVLDKNGVYTIESNDISGTIEFAISKLWINISESNIEEIACHSYLFEGFTDYPEESQQ